MKTLYFRFLDNDDKPTGWVGFVAAKSMSEVFDIIDEFGDPYSVQVCEAKTAGFCVQWKSFTDDSGEAVMEGPPELAESMPWVFDDENWVRPAWSIH
jgi:hypothetical protein